MRPIAALAATLAVAGCAERVEIRLRRTKAVPVDAWADLLSRASTPEGVDYDLVEANRLVLHRYLVWVGEHGPYADDIRESLEDRRISFLVNAHNAAVIEGVLRNRPLDSVGDVRVGLWRWPGAGFFRGQMFRVDGEWLDLHTLRNLYIVARYQEPLVHVTLACGARGCPRPVWWDDDDLQGDMEAALSAWLATGGAMVEDGDGWALNEVFFRYREDFTDWSDAATVCEWLAPFAEGERRAWLLAHADDCPAGRIPFDWTLDARP